MNLNSRAKTIYKETVSATPEAIDGILNNENAPKIRIVVKRDGTEEKYNVKKIKRAVEAAFDSIDAGIPDHIWRRFNYYLKKFDFDSDNDKVTVEEIQDFVEYFLMKENPDVAKRYIIYREERKKIRSFVDNKIKWINNYKKASNTANATVDDNSNVRGKNVGIINAEIHKEDNIQISRGMIMHKLKELYPDFNSKRYIYDLTSHIIYKNDESSFAGAIAPYCCSISMFPFLISGLREIAGLSANPQNLDSFCGLYINLIFAVAGQFAGAVATPEFLCYFDYFARKDLGEDYYEHSDDFVLIGPKLKELERLTNYRKVFRNIDSVNEVAYNKGPKYVYSDEATALAQELSKSFKNGKLEDDTRTIKSYIFQKFQQVIYSINQPSAARGLQSAFVNFSYFDKGFFDNMLGKNTTFTFPDMTKPKWESLSWIQKEFMKWFNVERLKTVITFPVESLALIYKDGKFEDEDTARFAAAELARGHSMFVYISDTADSLSSCCFEGSENVRFYRNGIELNTTLKEFVNSQSAGINKDGSENLKYDAFVDAYDKLGNFHSNVKVTGILKKKYTGKMYEIVAGGKKITVTADHLIAAKEKDSSMVGEIAAVELEFKPENFLVGIAEGEKTVYAKIDSIKKIDVVDKVVYDIQLENYHHFAANGIITHNCRLKNKITTHEFNFTNGNIGVETGSKSVITLNLSRITQNFCRENADISFDTDRDEWYKRYKKYLNKILDRVYKYHTAYNELLWDMYDAHLLTIYKAGFISLDKQYLTVGLNGLNQAAEFLKIRCNDNPEYSEFCRNIFSDIKDQNTKHKGVEFGHKLTFNTEQIPAESLAVKNYNWDKRDGYWVPDNINLYASYIFEPYDNTVSVLEKLKMHGNDYIGDYLDGGAAAHINLSEHPTESQYWKLLNYAGQVGCQYWTVNVPNRECKCGYIAKHQFTKCPKCGATSGFTDYSRIIGYLTPIKNWSQGRQIEEKKRIYSKVDKNLI